MVALVFIVVVVVVVVVMVVMMIVNVGSKLASMHSRPVQQVLLCCILYVRPASGDVRIAALRPPSLAAENTPIACERVSAVRT